MWMLVTATIWYCRGQVLLTHVARAGSAKLNIKGVKMHHEGEREKNWSTIEEVAKTPSKSRWIRRRGCRSTGSTQSRVSLSALVPPLSPHWLWSSFMFLSILDLLSVDRFEWFTLKLNVNYIRNSCIYYLPPYIFSEWVIKSKPTKSNF